EGVRLLVAGARPFLQILEVAARGNRGRLARPDHRADEAGRHGSLEELTAPDERALRRDFRRLDSRTKSLPHGVYLLTRLSLPPPPAREGCIGHSAAPTSCNTVTEFVEYAGRRNTPKHPPTALLRKTQPRRGPE